MHILFIVNPISGLGLGKELPEKIRRIPEYDSIPYDIVFTEYAGHARKLVEDARQEGKYTHIVAVGGDGTVNEGGGVMLLLGSFLWGVAMVLPGIWVIRFL